MRKIISIVVVGIFLLSALGAIGLAEKNDEIQIEEIKFSLKRPLIKENDEFSEIIIKNTNSYIMEPGKPILPCYKKTYKFSIGTDIKDVNVILDDKENIKLEKELKIAPQPIQIKKINTENKIIQKREKLIDSFPEKEFSYNIGRGIEDEIPTLFLTINVNPCSFNPKDNTVTIARNIKISISLKKEQNSEENNDLYNFLILTTPEFSDELQPLLTHKQNKGISTKIVNLNEIYSGYYFTSEGRDNIEEIKYFIKNAYDNWGTRNVMLVGGANLFPARTTYIKVLNEENPQNSDDERFLSDLYYADIYDGDNNFVSWDSNENNLFAEINQALENDTIDLYPDVKLGRLACTNEEEVTTVVNKIISYENSKAWTKNWFNNIILIGGDTVPGPLGDDTNVDEGELVNQAVFNVMDGFIPTKLWGSNGKLGSLNPTGVDRINSKTNNGCGFIDWSGHGAPWVWTTFPHNGRRQVLPSPYGSYTNGDIEDLENGDMLPIVMCGGCSLGKYESDDNCFAWSYLSNPNGGGIGSFGASGLGYVYLGPWATFALVEGLMLKFYESYYDNAFSLGEIWSDAYNNYINDLNDIEDYYLSAVDFKTLTEVHMFGDPTLQLRSDSLPPEKPTDLSGPSGEIEKGEEYTYSATAQDPNDDQIYYLFDWGDETFSEWLGPYNSGETVETNKKWNEKGEYEIRVKAKDVFGVQGEWSDPISITVPKAKTINFLLFEKIMFLLEKYFPNIIEILT